jgi:H+-transporting ATPase
MAERAGASGDVEKETGGKTGTAAAPGVPGRVSLSGDRRGSRRVSRASAKEDWSNLDEYGKLVKYISTFRDKGEEGGEGNVEERRVWYAPWKKRKVHIKTTEEEPGKVPDDWLITDIKRGLPSGEIQNRRRRCGWNELVSEKENPIAKILSYFRGPILYGMSMYTVVEHF